MNENVSLDGLENYIAPDDLETKVALMAKIGRCLYPSISPDGTEIAFISNLNGLPQIWTVPVEGGWPKLVTALDDQIYGVQWSPDGSSLAFTLAPGGGMNQQIYLTDLTGRKIRRLSNGGKENNWLGDWTRDGRMLAVASNRRSPNAMDAYLVDVESGQWHLVAENQGIGYITDVSRDGKLAIIYRMINRSDNDLYLVNLEIGEETLLTPHEGPGSFQNARFSPDGHIIYLSSNYDRDLIAFSKIVLDENNQPGAIEIIAEQDDAELQTFEITEDGRIAALVWNVSGSNELSFMNLMTHAVSPGPMLPAEVIYALTFSKDGQLLSMMVSGSAAPWDIWAYRLDQDSIWQVTHSPHAGVALDELVRPSLVRFDAHDGLELSGWLYKPDTFAEPGAVVLSFHGGPEAQEQPMFNSTYQALLSQGIAVFAPNVRGSAGFGKTFANLDNGPLRFNGVKDIESCVNYIVSAGVAHPDKIGIMGGSYGGFMVMAGLTEYPEFFAAAANLFGIVNFETFFEHTEGWMAEISKIKYGDPETQADLLRSLSPIHKIDKVVAATIVLHGANDTNVPVIEAEQVVENLEKRGVAVKYVLFPDEGHGFTKTPNRIRSTVEIVRWFADHLKPEPLAGYE